MSAITWMKPHELREVSKEIWTGLAWEDEGSGTSAAISLCSESQPCDVVCAVGFLSGRGLSGRYHS